MTEPARETTAGAPAADLAGSAGCRSAGARSHRVGVTRLRVALRAAAVAVLLAPLLACGVKGMPRPPEDTAPRPPGDFTAVRSGSIVKLAWSRPTESMDGEKLGDLARFIVERGGPEGGFAEIGRIAVDDNDRIRPQKHFAFVDEAPLPDPTVYRVSAVTSDGQYSAAVATTSEPATPAGKTQP
jgi:hypothetical protein